MGFGWQEIDKTLDLGYIRVAGLHGECKPMVLFDPPNFRPHTMTHITVKSVYEYHSRDQQIMVSKNTWSLCRGTNSIHSVVLNLSRVVTIDRRSL